MKSSWLGGAEIWIEMNNDNATYDSFWQNKKACLLKYIQHLYAHIQIHINIIMYTYYIVMKLKTHRIKSFLVTLIFVLL